MGAGSRAGMKESLRNLLMDYALGNINSAEYDHHAAIFKACFDTVQSDTTTGTHISNIKASLTPYAARTGLDYTALSNLANNALSDVVSGSTNSAVALSTSEFTVEMKTDFYNARRLDHVNHLIKYVYPGSDYNTNAADGAKDLDTIDSNLPAASALADIDALEAYVNKQLRLKAVGATNF